MRTNELKRLAEGAEERARAAAGPLGDLASDRGLLDVAIGTVDSPVGRLLVAVTARGLARVAFEDEDRDRVLEALARELSPRILGSDRTTGEARRELDEFFEAKRTRFDMRLDRRLIHGIAREVLAKTARVPFGHLTTYGEVARRIGRPRAARAVGNALGSNPIPIVIPCHRVVRSGGALGGYGGGIDRKALLLSLEGSLPEVAGHRPPRER